MIASLVNPLFYGLRSLTLKLILPFSVSLIFEESVTLLRATNSINL